MAADESRTGKPSADFRQATISGNHNSGIIAGGDVHGGVRLGNVPLPAAAEPSLPAESASLGAPALRILFLGANPDGAPSLRLDHEVREIDLALRQADFRERFDLRQQLAVRPADLQAALLRHRPHVVHFSGHGSPDGILLEDEVGEARKVQGNVVARILAVFKKQIRCVVLNACYSRDQAEAIARDIDCVIGMSTAIGDLAAVRFSSAFYQALAFGSSVAVAFELGSAQIDLHGLGEGDTPQLIAFKQDPAEVVFIEENP